MNLKRSKLLEIVKATGYSTATISRALNSATCQKVKSHTRDKITRAAEKLDYVPNRAARSLRTSKTNTIGYLVNFDTDSISGYMHDILNGILAGLRGSGYDLKIISSVNHSSIGEIIKIHGLDGIILPHNFRYAFPNIDKESNEKKDDVWPVVIVNDYHPKFNLSQLYSDNYLASKYLAEYLINRGHRNFYYIGCEGGSPDADERKRGFLDALKGAGIQFDAARDAVNGYFSEQGGYDRANELFSLKKDFRGTIFCANDAIALGVIRAIGEFGLNCPEDISVVGFDGIASGEYSNPPLTTIKFDLYNMGVSASKILQEIISGRQKNIVKQKFPFILVERKSCS